MAYATRMLLRSLRRTWPDHPPVTILHRGLTAAQFAALTSEPHTRLLPLEVPPDLMGPVMLHVPPAKADLFYGRFAIWGEAFADYDRVLYLDVDILVRGDLAEILEEDFFMATNVGAQELFLDGGDPQLVRMLEEDGLADAASDVGNAGVLVVARKWRAAGQLDSIKSILHRYRDHLRFGDQTVLNLWMATNDLRPADSDRFNCQILQRLGEPGGRSRLHDAGVLHFSGFLPSHRRAAMTLAYALLSIPGAGMDLFWASMRALYRGARPRAPLRAALRLYGRGKRLTTRGAGAARTSAP